MSTPPCEGVTSSSGKVLNFSNIFIYHPFRGHEIKTHMQIMFTINALTIFIKL